MTKISYDKSSQCWREDPRGHFLGIFTKKRGWIPMFTVITANDQEAQNG